MTSSRTGRSLDEHGHKDDAYRFLRPKKLAAGHGTQGEPAAPGHETPGGESFPEVDGKDYRESDTEIVL